MQTSISGAGIQRPLVFFDLFHYPANEASAVTDSVWFPRTLSVRVYLKIGEVTGSENFCVEQDIFSQEY